MASGFSHDLVSAETSSILDEMTAWRARPLESSYAIVFFDAVWVKILDEDLVKNRAVNLAIYRYLPFGHKQVLGLWIERSEVLEIMAGSEGGVGDTVQRKVWVG